MERQQSIEATIRAAFLAGYREGYDNGSMDSTSYEWGHSKHTSTVQQGREKAVEDYVRDPW